MQTKNNSTLSFIKNKLVTKSTLLMVGLVSTFSLFSQSDDSRENFTFGVKAGINRANVWDEQGQDFRADPKTGFAAGVFLGLPLGAVVGFQPELMFSQKGFVGTGTLLGTGYSLKRTSTFIDVPLQLQIKPISVLTILVGPQYSYLIRQKDVYTLGANSSEQLQEFNNDNVRKNILGFVIGADINIEHLVLSGRLAWDIINNNGDGTTTTPRYKNELLQFTIGYKL
jgi:hypothetical protein